MADEIEATRCHACGTFSIGDECCGQGKPFDTSPLITTVDNGIREPATFFSLFAGGIPRGDRAIDAYVRVRDADQVGPAQVPRLRRRD